MSIETATVIGIAAFGLPLLFVLVHPLLVNGARLLVDNHAEMEVEELLTERERSYTALADLDFDFECGKMSERDYQRLRGELMSETAGVLGQLDERISKTKAGPVPKQTRSQSQSGPKAKPTVTINEDAIEREITQFKQRRSETKKDG